jgi:hypothetical protein
MRNRRLQQVIVWVIVIGMVLGLLASVISLFA